MQEVRYIVYDREEVPCFEGDARSCSKYLGVTIGSFYSRISRRVNNEVKIGKWIVSKIKQV